ncbi:OmpA family protein [Maribacter arenosus]|uniref:OmpA family protein n=1 Tax=Maribacter arenosus TaxID=1854708 RepID=A0ABR7VB86_9FLAO|nr:OmpA family protein [Maribacter arenosus]MBD0849314.1 OmpA family protein [Maribacter arenosus]
MLKPYFLLIFTFVFASITAQTDVKNSKDYPLLERLPDYSIIRYAESEFDAQKFYYDNEYHMVEGRKFVIEYSHNNRDVTNYEFPTRLQILRNYSSAIKKAGGRILFERHNSEHGYYSFETSNGKEIWVQVKTAISGKSYTLIIIEQEKMRQDIVIDSKLIKNKLEIDGKIALYGIYFDPGKSIIKEESEPALMQIANYLKDNPSINCWVVGHTDSDGSFELNSQLSLARAKAIQEELQKKYGIPEKRLFAEGVGPLAPLASNATEDGKKLNRRVELVKK